MNAEQLLEQAKGIENEIIENRRFLHANAEVGFELEKTKKFVIEKLSDIGCKPQECGRAGVTAVIGKGRNGKVFLLRADMDALNIKEETELEFACKNGRMHACGHDMHTAMLLGAAKLLKMHEEEIEGTVKLMFQPAEETLEGAADMIENGVLSDPEPGAAMMLHVITDTDIPAGSVIVASQGVSSPAADYFTITVQGKGCHGSMPQAGVDAVCAAAYILISLQEISARELAASDEAVITIGAFNGGSSGNVIADSAVMCGTMRAYDENIREMIKRRISEISVSVASAFRASAEVVFTSGTPSLLNDREISSRVEQSAVKLLGKERVYTTASFERQPQRSGGSEDFANISRKIPSVMVALAAGERKKGFIYPTHHPKVCFDEAALVYGCAVYAFSAAEYTAFE